MITALLFLIIVVLIIVLGLFSVWELSDNSVTFHWLIEHWALRPYKTIELHLATDPAVWNGTHLNCPPGFEVAATMRWPGAVSPEKHAGVELGMVWRNALWCVQRDPQGEPAASWDTGT